jgi:hypothetical protein
MQGYESIRLTLEILSLTIDECPIGAVVDEDLHPKDEYKLLYKGRVLTHLCVLFPYLSMLVDSRITIVLSVEEQACSTFKE